MRRRRQLGKACELDIIEDRGPLITDVAQLSVGLSNVEESTVACPIIISEMSLDVGMIIVQGDHRHQEAIVAGTNIEVGTEVQNAILAADEVGRDRLLIEMDGI